MLISDEKRKCGVSNSELNTLHSRQYDKKKHKENSQNNASYWDNRLPFLCTMAFGKGLDTTATS